MRSPPLFLKKSDYGMDVDQCMGRLLGVISRNPIVSNSIQLHIVIFWFFLINLRFIP